MDRLLCLFRLGSLATVSAMFVAAGCAGPGLQVIDRAPVPEGDRRLRYTFSGDAAAVVEQAITETACLLLSGDWELSDCRGASRPESLCDMRSLDEAKAAVAPAIREIPRLRLTSSAQFLELIRTRIPSAEARSDVADARRTAICSDWSDPDGTCGALKVDKIWIFLHAPAGGDGAVDWFEVYLAEPVCTDEFSPGSQT